MALRELRIANLAVIAEARLQLDGGFAVLTGETGAGKSVCVTALRVALGGRAEPDLVRAGAESAVVAAVFDAAGDSVRARMRDLGIPDDELLTLSREVPRSGRTTCRVNGALVSQAVVRELADALVDVTAQGASQRLMRRAWQRDLLDASGGEALRAARAATEAAVRAWRTADAALQAGRRAATTGAADLQRARDLIAALEPLRLGGDDQVALQAERLRLRHAAGIASAALGMATASGDDDAAADRLAAAVAEAAGVAAVDPELQALTEEAADLVERLRELATACRRHAVGTTVDEARLAAVEERLDDLDRVSRRHGSIEAALADLATAGELIAAVGMGAGELQRLAEAASARHRVAASAALALSGARASAARRLEGAVTNELRRLELPHARFRVMLSRTLDPEGIDAGDGATLRCGPGGIDDVDFRLAANRDAVPVPLDGGPSGGELSRVALALNVVVAEEDPPILVLDEIDSGIGGETAARVGDVLAGIGARRQVLAVTHRPEIAARASGHLVVTKLDAAGGALASVESLSGDARVVEVARLMSGRVTDAARARAGELLDEGAAVHRGGTGVRTM